LPRETLAPGPCGYRVAVIDYDSSTDTLYAPLDLGPDGDPFEDASDDELLGNPKFHQQNVYAIAMCTLARFEFALGRRAAWSIRGHQIKIAPHAFCDPNAFYSESDEALMFGYFPSGNGAPVYSCLSHDVVVHETTHALVDGLRTRYTDASSPDQAAFHEGFADIVALLSVFAQENVMHALLPGQAREGGCSPSPSRWVPSCTVCPVAPSGSPSASCPRRRSSSSRSSARPTGAASSWSPSS
jgi:hypothetical protein